MSTINGASGYQHTNGVMDVKNTPASVKNTKSDIAVQEQNSEKSVVYNKSQENQKTASAYDNKGKGLSVESMEKLRAQAEMHYADMIEAVKAMVAKQGQEAGGVANNFDFSSTLPDSLKELYDIDGLDIAEELKKHEGEDLDNPESYWSAEKTSERIIDFAKTISGGNTEKYELLKGAIEDGFKAAGEYFDEMPDITNKTYDLVMKGLNDWAGIVEEK